MRFYLKLAFVNTRLG